MKNRLKQFLTRKVVVPAYVNVSSSLGGVFFVGTIYTHGPVRTVLYILLAICVAIAVGDSVWTTVRDIRQARASFRATTETSAHEE